MWRIKRLHWNTELKYRIDFEKSRKMFDWHAKNCAFRKISEFYGYFTICALCSQFSRLKKWFDIFVFSVLMRVFWTITRLYSSKIYFKLYYRGPPPQIKNSFGIPWPRAIKCPPIQNFKKKNAAPYCTSNKIEMFQTIISPIHQKILKYFKIFKKLPRLENKQK